MELTRKLWVLFAAVLVITGCAPLEETRKVDKVEEASAFAPEQLMIADFDNGMKPNNVGGDFGAWDKDPNDPTQFCEAEFSSDEKVGDSGYSMKLVYDVDSPQPAYNGFWMKLEDADFTPYSTLAINVKGDAEKGFTNKFVIEMKNSMGESGKALIPVSGEWQERAIPLTAFSGIKNFSAMGELVIVFDDRNSTPKSGAIYVDSIYVRK